MMLHCGNVWKSIISGIKSHIKDRTKLATAVLVTGLVSDLTRSKADLLVENALLRQRLIVLERQVKRPQFGDADRLWFVLLSSCTKYWKQALHIVQPDTVLRWHREIFRRYWRKKSKGVEKKPKVEADTIELIRQMAKENPFWGAERIRGELLKLGTKVSKRTVQKYMVRARKSRSSGQNWATFLKNHACEIWACDFTTAYDWLFRQYYIFIIIELKTRRIIHWAVTQAPTDEWTAQQMREATPWNEGPKYLIRDRDSKYGARFSAVCLGSGIEELKTPYRTPNANAVCERYIGSLRRECLDQHLFIDGRHLERVVKEYVSYYNQDRPHQGINQQIPINYGWPRATNMSGKVRSTPVMGGLYQSYSREVARIPGG